jgi:FkbM family methyltransferase
MVVHDPGQHIQRKWAGGIFYEQDPPAHVIDVGACIGNHSVWFAKAFGSNVTAIEPHEPYLAHLRENLAANNIDAIVHDCALGSRPALADTKLVGCEGMTTVVKGWRIHVKTLDFIACLGTAMEIQRPDVIKIDVEGYEMPVLRGAQRVIDRWRPVLYVEGNALMLEVWCEANDYRLAATMNATPTHALIPLD